MESNTLIADFMGWELQYQLENRWHGSYREPNGKLHRNTDTEPLLFHASWDWLMPVVREVIVRYQVDEGVEIDYTELQSRVMDNDIERAYEEVVEFIKEYNDDSRT